MYKDLSGFEYETEYDVVDEFCTSMYSEEDKRDLALELDWNLEIGESISILGTTITRIKA